MNRILFLMGIAGLTFLVVLFIRRPDILSNAWLWLVGLAGPIAKIGDAVATRVKKLVSPSPSPEEEMKKNTDESGGGLLAEKKTIKQ